MGNQTFKMSSLGLTPKLVGLLLIFACVPMAVQAFIGFTATQNMESNVGARFQVTAETIADKIDRNLFERYGDVQAFGKNRILWERYNWYTKDEESNQISQVMNEYVATYGIYYLCLFVDTEGDVIAVNSRDARGQSIGTAGLYQKNYKNTPWFQALASRTYTKTMPFTTLGNDVSTGTFIEDIHVDPDVKAAYPGDDGLTIGFSAPVYQKGDLIGYWTNRAKFSLVEEIVQQTYRELRAEGYPHAEITLLDSEGRVIVDYDPSRQGTEDVKHDFSQKLMKLNLAQQGVWIAQEAVAGKTGHAQVQHVSKDEWQVGGYTHLKRALGYPGMNWSVLVRVPLEEAAADAYSIRWELMLAAILCLGAVFPLGVIIGRAVISRLRPVMEVAKRASQGDLTGRVPVKGGDELAQIARGFNQFLDDLNGVLSKTAQIAQSVAAASEQLSANGNQVAQASQEQSSQSSATASAVEEMAASAKEMASNAREMSTQAKELSQVARHGGEIVGNSIKGMEAVAQTMESCASRIQVLGQRSQEIGEIIRVIEDIADQTNLLALNAAIEAARAGEQGRGFAVVADEVRKLAERTGKATKEIAAVIENVQNGTRQAVSSMESGTGQVQEGMTLVHEAGKRLEEIVRGVNQVTEMVGHIAVSIDQQKVVTEQMATGVQTVASLSHQNEANVAQVAAATDELSRMASQLQEYLSSFTLKT